MSSVDLSLLSNWQFELPAELIASRPTDTRDGARLLVVDRQKSSITHARIRDLPNLLKPNDLLVFNNTKVLPARLFGVRTATGGRWEGLYVEEILPAKLKLQSEYVRGASFMLDMKIIALTLAAVAGYRRFRQ